MFNMKRILFIQPPFFRFLGIQTRYFPYQFVSMGTYLKQNGHSVRIFEGDKCSGLGNLDFSDQEKLYYNYLEKIKNFSDPFWQTLEEVINDFKPDFIGITFWTTFIASAIRTAQYCKMVFPSATIIAGGPHVTLLPDDIKKIDEIDIGVMGEGEHTILEIVNGKPIHSICGVFYTFNGNKIQNPPRNFEKYIDTFGIPDRSLLINHKNYTPEDMGLLMTSRGCPFKCAYCATKIWKNNVRSRSIDNIIKEIKLVNKEYGTIYFTIKDDSFTIDKKFVYNFCNHLKKENLDIFWECNANLQTIDRDMLKEMISAGCIAIKVGIESGSDKIHPIINKKLTNNIIKSKIKIFNRLKIHLTCYFMMGIPGEKKEDILKTLSFARQLKPDFISLSIYEIFPGTKLHQLGIEDNTAVEQMDIADYFKIQPHNYFYANFKRSLAGMTHDEFDSLEKHFKKKIHKYNRSPRNIYRRIRSRLPIYKIDKKYFFDDARKFLKWV
jgi:anaerobic magnesium-protoporphyrin IX monomethyl ester cyclase